MYFAITQTTAGAFIGFEFIANEATLGEYFLNFCWFPCVYFDILPTFDYRLLQKKYYASYIVKNNEAVIRSSHGFSIGPKSWIYFT
jgi:hypothetical protein